MNRFDEFSTMADKSVEKKPNSVADSFPLMQKDIEMLRGLFGDFKILAISQGDVHVSTSLNRMIEAKPSIDAAAYLEMGKVSARAEKKGRHGR